MDIKLTKSLQELEGEDWGEPDYQSYVVVTCHRMRRKCLGDLTNEELRLAIGQKMSLGYLLPLAITRLLEAPLISGDFHAGDLLKNCLRLPRSIWAEQAWSRECMTRILAKFSDAASLQDEYWKEAYLPELQRAAEDFVSEWRQGKRH